MNLYSLRLRKNIARIILLLAIITGTWVASLGNSDEGGVEDGTLPSVLEFLAELEVAHILAHVAIFASVGFLLGDWHGGSRKLAWQHIFWGAIIMEALQVIVGIPHDSIPALVWGVGFDLVVDCAAGWLGLHMVDYVGLKS